MEFEFYDGSTRFGQRVEQVKITGKHLIFTVAAVERYIAPLLKKLKLKGLISVRIGFNKTHKVIGFFPQAEPALTDIRPCKTKKCKSLTFWVQGFVRQHGLEPCLLNVEQVEGGLHLKAGEKLLGKRRQKKQQPPDPSPGQQPTPEAAKKRVDYECAGCGHTNPAWKYNKTLPNGYPDRCIKCGGTHFQPVA